MNIAIYPGTFDPITNGHIDILKKAVRIFDKVIIAVAEETGKNTLFNIEERKNICSGAVKNIAKVEVSSFDGLVVNFAKKMNASTMIRGMRAVSDFEYELQLVLMNKKLDKDIETIFLLPNFEYLYLSSSMVKKVMKLGGKITGLIPENVETAMREKIL